MAVLPIRCEPITGRQGLKKFDWIERIVEAEGKYLEAFFGKAIDIVPLQKTLQYYGEERIANWKRLDLEVHFLPQISLYQEVNFPGWKIKPEDWFWEKLKGGKLYLRSREGELEVAKAANLSGIVALIDIRQKPPYRGGQQMFLNDDSLLGSVLSKLRKQGKIATHKGPLSSRFSVSADEWETHIRPTYAAKMGFDSSRVRLEKVIEVNTIPQIYQDLPRANDGQTDTWIWCEEHTEDLCRLSAASVDRGGLKAVYDNYSVHNWDHRAVRPLIVLTP
ncbi:MAG: hypothetical protein ACYDET_06480 [Thermoleophilia bacterium]